MSELQEFVAHLSVMAYRNPNMSIHEIVSTLIEWPGRDIDVGKKMEYFTDEELLARCERYHLFHGDSKPRG